MSYALKLHERLTAQVKTERKITHEILLTIQEFDSSKAYREIGYSSLFDYLFRGQRYSEGAANRRMAAARLLGQCPSLATKIRDGRVNLSQLALAQSAFKQEEKKLGTELSPENKEETLRLLEGQTHFNSQKVLLSTFPDFKIPKPKVVPTKDKTVKVELEFSTDDWEMIQELLNGISHKVPDQKLESALIYWAKLTQKKRAICAKEKNKAQPTEIPLKDAKNEITHHAREVFPKKARNKLTHQVRKVPPEEVGSNLIHQTREVTPEEARNKITSQVREASPKETRSKITHQVREVPPKAARNKITREASPKGTRNNTVSQATMTLPPNRRSKLKRQYISVKVKRQVFAEAKNQCEYVSPITGKRCQSHRFLDIDHRIPLALNGTNEKENLRIFCRAHNHLVAEQMGLFADNKSIVE